MGGENDGDLAASGDRSFAYTERVLFSPESRARVHLPPATIPIIDRAINDRSTNISGQRSFSERVGQASAVISDAAESGPFSLPFGLRLKNGSGNNGTGGRKVRKLKYFFSFFFLDGATLYASSYKKQTLAIDGPSGRPLWSQEHGGAG